MPGAWPLQAARRVALAKSDGNAKQLPLTVHWRVGKVKFHLRRHRRKEACHVHEPVGLDLRQQGQMWSRLPQLRKLRILEPDTRECPLLAGHFLLARLLLRGICGPLAPRPAGHVCSMIGSTPGGRASACTHGPARLRPPNLYSAPAIRSRRLPARTAFFPAPRRRAAALAALLALGLAACGRYGPLEPPPDAGAAAKPALATPAANATTADALNPQLKQKIPPIVPPNQPFILDPLLK
jgi:predicted small lipoprotein YifL